MNSEKLKLKRNLRNKAINYLASFGSTEEEKNKTTQKFKNVCGKTGMYNVPPELFQNRTSRKGRILISWKTVKNNNLTLNKLETFSGGVVVEFVNEDYFKTDNDPNSLFNELKSRLGSDEIVSTMISIRNEDGTSSSSLERNSYEKLKCEIDDYKNHFIKRKNNISGEVNVGNEKIEGFIFYSIKGGSQDSIESHNKDHYIFNPACEFANPEVCLDIDLILIYFAMFSIDKTKFNVKKNKEYNELLNEIKSELKTRNYDGGGNLLDYCNNHPCILLEPGKLYDPILIEEIKIEHFSIDNKNDLNSLDLSHNEAVNKGKYYFGVESIFP